MVGFGHLVPNKEAQPVLGITWDSCSFPQQTSAAAVAATPAPLAPAPVADDGSPAAAVLRRLDALERQNRSLADEVEQLKTMLAAGASADAGNPTRLTVFVGGTRNKAFRGSSCFGQDTSLDEEAVVQTAREAVQRHLGIHAVPVTTRVNVCDQAIAQYKVGHHAHIQTMEGLAAEMDPRFTLCGSALYGVALNDIVTNARETASRMDTTFAKYNIRLNV